MTTSSPAPERPPRSAERTLAQAILALESFGAIFAAALLAGFAKTGDVVASSGAIWGGGVATAVLLLVGAGFQGRPWGRGVGWILQVPMVAAAIVSPAIGVVGVMFVVLWFWALRIGGRIDRERAEYRASRRDDGGGE